MSQPSSYFRQVALIFWNSKTTTKDVTTAPVCSVAGTYVPGRDMLLADSLSRAYLPGCTKGMLENDVEHVNMINFAPISGVTMQVIHTGYKGRC